MYVTDDFYYIQGMLITANQKFGPLKNLYNRGGNEEPFTYVVGELHKFLKSKKYMIEKNKESENILRKTNLFLAVNSDLNDIDLLIEEKSICHMVSICPRLSKCLFMEIVWNFNLGTYLYEVLVFCPVTMSIDLLDAAVTSIRFSKPYQQLQQTQIIAKAIYSKIHRLKKDKIYGIAFDDAVTHYCTKFVELLNYFISPDSEVLKQFKKKELYRYCGYSMNNILKLTYDCLTLFLKEDVLTFDLSEMYNLDYSFGSEIYYSEKTRIEKISTCLNNCNDCLFSTCKANLLAINVNIYCAWAEYIDKNQNKSLQELVANCAYEINELIDKSDIEEEELYNLLLAIARKAKSLKEEIESADLKTIMENAQIENEQQHEWIKVFLKYDKLLLEKNTISSLKNVLKYFNYEESLVLLNRCYEVLSLSDVENGNKIKEIAFETVNNLPAEDRLNIICAYFSKNGLNSKLDYPDIDNGSVTELINKIVLEITDNDWNRILNYVLQDPIHFITVVFEKSIENRESIEVMCNILDKFDSLCALPIQDDVTLSEQCFKDICNKKKWTESESKCFNLLLSELNDRLIIDVEVVARKVIIPCFGSYIDEESFLNANVMLKVLLVLYDSLYPLKRALICYVADLIENVRCDLMTFSADRCVLVKTCIKFIKKIASDSIIRTDRETETLKEQLKSLSPLNKYYFEPLWNNDKINFLFYNSFIETGKNIGVCNMIRMCEILPSCITDEWILICKKMLELYRDPLKVFQQFSEYFLLLTTLFSKSTSEYGLSSIQNSVYNFSIILNDEICPRIEDSYNAQLIVWERLIHIIYNLDNNIKACCSMMLLNTLVSILDSLKTKNADVNSVLVFNLVKLEKLEICEVLCKKIMS